MRKNWFLASYIIQGVSEAVILGCVSLPLSNFNFTGRVIRIWPLNCWFITFAKYSIAWLRILSLVDKGAFQNTNNRNKGCSLFSMIKQKDKKFWVQIKRNFLTQSPTLSPTFLGGGLWKRSCHGSFSCTSHKILIYLRHAKPGGSAVTIFGKTKVVFRVRK